MSRDRLFQLVPAAMRQRDAELSSRPGGGAEGGGPLAALLGLVGDQVLHLREDLRQLYDDQFIETCAEWVVPYIGDLIGHEPRHGTIARIASPRAEVARTVGYRRRKGTAAVLQQVGQDVTGWPTRVVEVFRRIATTQHVDFHRPEHTFTPDLRRARPGLEAFANHPMRPDVRSDRHLSLPDVVAHVWRLRAFPLQRVTPFAVDTTRFTFSPLGDPVPLFSRPPDTEEAGLRDDLAHVPGPIGRRELFDRLAVYYGEDRSLWVRIDGVLVPPERIDAADLSDLPPGSGTWGRGARPVPATSPVRVAVDPVLGRLAVSRPVGTIEVGYHIGAAAGLGGGQYERDSLGPDAPPADLVVHDQGELAKALPALVAGTRGSTQILELATSATLVFTAPSPTIALPAERTLVIRAADRERPVIQLGGDLVLERPSTGDSSPDVELRIDGLVVTGGGLVLRPRSGVRRLVLEHCTLVPGIARDAEGAPLHLDRPSLVVDAPDVEVVLRDCITGPLRIAPGARVQIVRSIVDAGPDGLAYSAPDGTGGGALDLDRASVIGRVHAISLGRVSNSILHGDVESDRRQAGCIRFSVLPADSKVPRRFHCLPAESDAPDLAAQFSSLRYGAPAYVQLSRRCAPAIRFAADDESEPGVFHDLFEPHREGNLRARLDEYLRLGLRVGVNFVT